MTITGEHIIASTFTTSNGNPFQATNPVTGEALPTEFHEASEAEINQAAEQAEAAFLIYRKKSGAEKAEFLDQIGEEIMNLGDELIERCQQETGLPAGRLQGERGRTVNQLKMFAQLLRDGWWVDARIDTAQPDRQPLPKPDIRQMQIALGPVGIFGASNFPLAFSVAGGDTASALAAGCTIVVKGHPAHPGTSELVGRAIVRAAEATGMPKGVFSLVQGTTVAVGQALVKHPLIKAVGLHRFIPRGQGAVRRGQPAARAHSRLRRDGQHQPGIRAARSAARTQRTDCRRPGRLGHAGCRAVLHQPRLSGLVGLCRYRCVFN